MLPPSLPVGLAAPRAGPPAPGFPPDVAPNQVIFSSHINLIRDSVALWPGDVNAQDHWLRNVKLENVTGVMVDPTTTAGDLLARGAGTAPDRLPIGSAGQVLTVDISLPQKLKWAMPVGQVASVFGRQGAVVAQAGDYTAEQVTNAVSTAGAYADPPWLTSIAWGKITSAPATFPPSLHTHDAGDVVSGRFNTARLGGGIADATVFLRGDGLWAPAGGGGGGGAVSSVFGRIGAVIAQSGDYSVAQVTGALADVTQARGDLITRAQGVVQAVRLPVGGDGQVLTADSTQGAGLKWATVTGTFIDPTNTKGDILVRSASALTRLPVGADGQVLTTDSAAPNGIKWGIASGGGAVSSVFTRTGAVVAQAGDYTAAQVLNAVSDLNVYSNPAWIGSLAWSKITGAPSILPDPTTTKGDILARSAGAVDRLPVGGNGMVLTADSAQSLGVKWAVPATAGQTPWLTNIDAANHSLLNVAAIGIGTGSPGYPLDVVGAIKASGSIYVINPSADAVFSFDCQGVTGIFGPSGSAVLFGSFSNHPMRFIANSTEWMRITAAGNVGIARADPTQRLDVLGEVYVAALFAGAASAGCVGIGSYQNCGLIQGYTDHGTSTATSIILQPSGGSVGIGCPPVYPFHVRVGTDLNLRFAPSGAWFSIDTANDASTQNTPLRVTASKFNFSSGNMGLSTDSAFSKLSMGGAVADITNRIAFFEHTSGAAIRGIGMCNAPGGGYGVAIWAQGTAVLPTNSNVQLFIGDTVGAAGTRIGIETVTPGAKLHVQGNGQSGDTYETTSPSYGVLNEAVYIKQLDATPGSGGAVVFGSPFGGGPAPCFAAIKGYVTDGSGNSAGFLRFYTRADPSHSYLSCRAQIDSANMQVFGNVSITGQYQVNGAPFVPGVSVYFGAAFIGTRPGINFANGSGTTVGGGAVTADHVTVFYNVTSDRRIKQNITELRGGLSVIEQLRPVAYEWNGAVGFEKGKRSMGIIADELKPILPDTVYSIRRKLFESDAEETDLLCYDPNHILFHLVLAVQQLRRQLAGARA